MSNALSNTSRTPDVHAPARRLSTETKASMKTSELVASAVVDKSDFGAQEAWLYVTLLTVGYMISRGLAKSGSRDYYTDNDGEHTSR